MKNRSRPQLIIYDLDGTLIDSVPDIARALDLAVQTTLALTVTCDQVKPWIGNGSVTLVERAVSFLTDNPIPDTRLVDETHRQFLYFYSEHLDQPAAVYPGTLELLTLVKSQGIAQAIATNKPQQFVPAILKNAGLYPYVDAIVGGNSLPHKKPHPLPLTFLCNRFYCQPQNALMIGDSAADAASAFAAQVPCWLLEQGYSQGLDLKTLNAERVFKDTQALLAHFQQHFPLP